MQRQIACTHQEEEEEELPRVQNVLLRPRWAFSHQLRAVQSGAVSAPGLVNFITAIAYHFCLNLPAAFAQPGAST